MTAMALCPQPQLVVFDEPTTALDVVTQLEVLRAIKQAIAVHDTAAIYISHDLAVVAQVADDIMVLRNGETIEYGPVEQVFNAPQHEYTRQLFNAHRFSPTSPAPQDKCLLQVSHVYAGYDTSRDTVEDVSLEVERGETLAVIGESGSGKSTLTRIVSGLLPWRSGVISFAGQPLAPSYKNRPKHVLANIQLINQHPDMALNPRQKVATIVGRPLEFFFNMPADETTQRIRELMDWVELPYHLLERYPTELSGGQKQRLCIARALAAEPEIILCDEPTSALDSIIAKGVLDLLKRIQKDNHTSYLFLTHDLNVVRAIADRVAVMHRGKIVRYGKKDKVLSPPFDPYTGTLVSSVPQMRLGWLDTMIRN
jgi:peptide/nickel transport system ATP-binding protein